VNIKSALVRLGYALLRAGVKSPEMRLVRRFQEQAYLDALLRRLRIDCFIDVGANQGQFSKHLRMMGYKGRILSFEPSPADYRHLSRLARGDSLWNTFDVALGSEDAKKDFNVITLDDGSTDCSSLLTPKSQDVQSTIEVSVRRLDTMLETLDLGSARIFLKVDAQGYDVEVVKGASGFLDSILGLQSEISVVPIYDDMPHFTTALEYYESLGFSLMNLFVVNRTKHQAVLEYDCLMARVEHL
jgi:FkbM family methyltransferase